MLSGSSALNNEVGSQIKSPKLRIELDYGLRYISGLSPAQELKAGAQWQDWYLTIGTYSLGGGNIGNRILKYQPTNNSLSGGVSYSLNSNTSGGFFYQTGTSPLLRWCWAESDSDPSFTGQNSVKTKAPINITSFSMLWTANDTIYRGASSKYIYDAVMVDTGQVYCIQDDEDNDDMVSLYSIKSVGATWGATVVTRNIAQNQYFTGAALQKLTGWRDNDGIDVLYMTPASNNDGDDFYFTPAYYLREIRTDGYNVLGDKSITIPTTAETKQDGVVSVEIENMSRGVSWWYMPVRSNVEGYTSTGGATALINERVEAVIWKSKDLKNWEKTIRIGGFVGAGTTTSHYDLVVSDGIGINSDTYPFSGYRRRIYHSGVSSYDVSTDVIEYVNKDNESINITLANQNANT